MFQGVYIIWGLLPFALVALTFWALVKPLIGIVGREHPTDYFRQALFCCIGLALALWIDQTFFGAIVETNDFDPTDLTIVAHWLLYPIVLLVMSYLNKFYLGLTGRDRNKELSHGLARYKR